MTPNGTTRVQLSGASLQWHPAQGTLALENLPAVVMWIDTTLAGLMAGMQTMVGERRFSLALQSEGRKSVEDDWQFMSQFSNFTEGFAALAKAGAWTGWGNLQLISVENQECRFRVTNSWEGRYQKTLGVCWGSGILAGKAAGYCSKLFETNCWADQTAFIAKGDEYDEFVVRPSGRSIEEEIEKLLTTDEATRADMAVALQKRKQAEEQLRQYQEHLEELVTERTRELGKANAQLQAEIIERQQVEAALRQSEAQLQEQATQLRTTLRDLQTTQAQLVQTAKMSSLGQLVAGVAHEINNPVNFIHGNLAHADQYTKDILSLLQLYQQQYPNSTQLLQERIEAVDLDFLVKDFPKLLSSMRGGTERIREIVCSLRNFSRLDEAQVKMVDIHEGIESTLLILQNRLKANKPDHPEVQVIKEYSNLSQVECYAGQLNQVFMNIINNAVDALTCSPSPVIRICTKTMDNNHVAVRISDNGSGMTKEVLQRLFDPFFTTKPVGMGTGLGLSISYQIVVEKHGGQLLCASQLGQGTEFTILIPVQQEIKKSAALTTAN